ncbi:MAG: CRISPR-associated primase-polymerase type A1 [Candidatus Eremiobacterota bacterium]
MEHKEKGLYFMKEKLLEIKTFLDKGEDEKAHQLIRSLETVSVRDSALHLELVEFCEQCGVIEKIPGELHLALRDLPEDRNIIKKLALFYQDSGNFDKGEKYFRKLITLDPSDMDSYRELWNILEEKGDIDALQALSLKIKELFPDSDLANLKIENQKREEEHEEDEKEQDIEESGLIRFVSFFSGREGVYARQWASPTGETGYTPVKEPFNYKVAKNHLLGNYTVGIYQLRVDNTVNFIAFDIDITKRFLNRIISDKSLWKSAIKDAHTVACKIIDHLSSHDIPSCIEASGYKGRHCWIFLEKPLSAKIARAFALSVVNKILPLPEGIEIEIFPKQDYVRREGLGNLIKIPMGIHRKTGRKSQFIDPQTVKPFEDQMDFLDKMSRCPKEKIISLAEDVELPPYVEEEILPEEKTVPVIKSAPVEYSLKEDKEFQYLLLKCSVIKYLFDKIEEHHDLTNDEIVVLTYSLGHMDRGPDAVNSLLKLCPGTGTKYFLKSRLRGNPVSCPKIRGKIPDITSKLDCNCDFSHYSDSYPTPVLHIQDLKNPSVMPGGTLDSIQFQVLVQEYLNTRKQLKQLNERYKNQQNQLDTFFESAGITSIQTSFGLLKQVAGENGKVNYVLEL